MRKMCGDHRIVVSLHDWCRNVGMSYKSAEPCLGRFWMGENKGTPQAQIHRICLEQADH